jgi:putative glutamine amidotransferase
VNIWHAAVVAPDSVLAELTGPGEITVNSSHHQAIDAAGDGLRVVARSPEDGIIEAVEGAASGHWVLGVQWHPERIFAQSESARRIFDRLVAEARSFHQRLARGSPDFESIRDE